VAVKNIQIRDVPDDVAEAIAQRAKADGKSMQDFLLGVLAQEARFVANQATLSEIADFTNNSGIQGQDILVFLDENRAGREQLPDLHSDFATWQFG